MNQAYFLTGTDTGIGKTFCACALLHAWRNTGLSAVGYKPVAAGAELVNGRYANEDALALQAAGSRGFSLDEINPICLREAIAPHLAAQFESLPIRLAPILQGFAHLKTQAQRIIVEGVGGFRVPLGDDFDSADLASELNLPVILVVGLRLGCINHALLSVEAIETRGLKLAGWIGNNLQPAMTRLEENLRTLSSLLPAPCLGIVPRVLDADPAQAAAFLTLPA